jgi:hypothetical protein
MDLTSYRLGLGATRMKEAASRAHQVSVVFQVVQAYSAGDQEVLDLLMEEECSDCCTGVEDASLDSLVGSEGALGLHYS